MTHLNYEVLNAAAQDSYKQDLNGALRTATGLRLDVQGICYSLWGKEVGACHDELLATMRAGNDLHVTGSFEDGIVGWTTAVADLTAAHDPAVGFYGTDSISVTRINTDGVGQLFTGTAAGAKMAVAQGERIYSYAMVRHNSASAMTFAMQHRHYAATTLVTADTSSNVSVPVNTWTPLSFSFVAPATTDGVQFRISCSTLTVGDIFWVDGFTAGRYPRTAFKPGVAG